MRLCVAIPCFFGKLDFCEAIATSRALGYDAVETYRWKGLDFSRIGEALEKHGVELMSMCTTEFCMTDPSRRSLWLSGLEESCRAANKLGVKRLISQVGQDTGEAREKQHESILKALEQAKPILSDSGVTLMIEPLNTYVDHPGYYLWSSREGFDLIREADHPNVKLIYDIYHQQIMEGNIIPSITENIDLIAHLHCAGHPGRIEPWFGESDYRVIFNRVDLAGYKGACGLEYHPTLEPLESLRAAKELFDC